MLHISGQRLKGENLLWSLEGSNENSEAFSSNSNPMFIPYRDCWLWLPTKDGYSHTEDVHHSTGSQISGTNQFSNQAVNGKIVPPPVPLLTVYNPVQKELRHCVYFKKKFILGHLCFLFPSPPFQCCHGRKIYWKILHTQHWKGEGGNRQDSMQFYWKWGIHPRL